MFKCCPACNGRGHIYYDGATGSVFHDQSLPEDEIASLIGEWVTEDECDVCNGLAYVKAYENF